MFAYVARDRMIVAVGRLLNSRPGLQPLARASRNFGHSQVFVVVERHDGVDFRTRLPVAVRRCVLVFAYVARDRMIVAVGRRLPELATGLASAGPCFPKLPALPGFRRC